MQALRLVSEIYAGFTEGLDRVIESCPQALGDSGQRLWTGNAGMLVTVTRTRRGGRNRGSRRRDPGPVLATAPASTRKSVPVISSASSEARNTRRGRSAGGSAAAIGTTLEIEAAAPRPTARPRRGTRLALLASGQSGEAVDRMPWRARSMARPAKLSRPLCWCSRRCCQLPLVGRGGHDHDDAARRRSATRGGPRACAEERPGELTAIAGSSARRQSSTLRPPRMRRC